MKELPVIMLISSFRTGRRPAVSKTFRTRLETRHQEDKNASKIFTRI